MTSSLVRMRLHGYWRSGRAVPPLVTALVVIASLYGGGAEPAGEGFGLSAYILLPVLALQTKLLIDAEPDVARKMIVVCVGRRGDVLAGLLAAAVAGLAMIMIAIVLPFAIGGIAVHAPGPPFAAGFVLGIWAHLLILLPALALGALTSRAVTGSIGVGGAFTAPSEASRSYDEAERALRIRQGSASCAGVTVHDELGIYRLLAAVDQGETEQFVREWLGPLLDYDAAHRTGLVATLWQYYECGGNYDQTAEALFICRSTVRYRLRRIRQLTGLDLGDVDSRLNLHVATRAWRVMQGSPGRAP